jgi:hypothetical protein
MAVNLSALLSGRTLPQEITSGTIFYYLKVAGSRPDEVNDFYQVT